MGSIRGAALIAATAVLFLAGCGGSSSSSSTNDTANFKSDFTAVVSQFKGVSEGIGSTITTASNKTD
ncbi:MAG: hypothetical protein ACTHQQ_20165, partial [Solirubrobacteraceae bacterium]